MDIDGKKLASQVTDALRDAFLFGSQPLIGVDIGHSSIKMAALEKKGSKFKIISYSCVPLAEASLIEDEIQQDEEILKAIREAYQQLGNKNRYVNLGLFGPNTVARKLQLAGGTEEEIEDQVSWEAEQYLPFAIEDSSISHFVFGENQGGGVDVLVCAARNDVLLNFKDLVEEAGLKVKVVDLGIVAMCNVITYLYPELDENTEDSFVFLDIGAQSTSLVIYKAHKIMFAKEVPVGGGMITEEIQRQLGVNYLEAEDLKTMGDQQGNLPEEVVEIVDDVVESFFTEIKKTIDFYISSTQDEGLAAAYLTGGSCVIPGLAEGLENLLGVEVIMIDLFTSFDYNKKKFSKELRDDISSKAVRAIGLAMREYKK